MENEQLQVPPPSSSSASTSTTTSSSSSNNGRQPGPQISVYSGIPDRQTVQVIQQALHRQPNTAAQYLQQMYAAQQQHLMLQTAALQQQHLSSAQLQSLAAVQQASLAANRQGGSSGSNAPQQAPSQQPTINLATSPAAAQLINRAQSVNSAAAAAAASGITQQAVLLGNAASPALTASQAQMYLRAQMVRGSRGCGLCHVQALAPLPCLVLKRHRSCRHPLSISIPPPANPVRGLRVLALPLLRCPDVGGSLGLEFTSPHPGGTVLVCPQLRAGWGHLCGWEQGCSCLAESTRDPHGCCLALPLPPRSCRGYRARILPLARPPFPQLNSCSCTELPVHPDTPQHLPRYPELGLCCRGSGWPGTQVLWLIRATAGWLAQGAPGGLLPWKHSSPVPPRAGPQLHLPVLWASCWAWGEKEIVPSGSGSERGQSAPGAAHNAHRCWASCPCTRPAPCGPVMSSDLALAPGAASSGEAPQYQPQRPSRPALSLHLGQSPHAAVAGSVCSWHRRSAASSPQVPVPPCTRCLFNSSPWSLVRCACAACPACLRPGRARTLSHPHHAVLVPTLLCISFLWGQLAASRVRKSRGRSSPPLACPVSQHELLALGGGLPGMDRGEVLGLGPSHRDT
uniref:Polyhomeotic-like protein 2 n=1 Tax=Crocodylus porosus TaxID=8502 RepID=A0A7M4G0L4_CROPO